MSRKRPLTYAAALAVGVAVFAARESRAASAVTTTTTTLPSASPVFTPATTACIKQAAAEQKICKMVASAASCQDEYDTAFPNCFSPGKGVACAATCVAKNANGTASAQTTDKQCTKTCQDDWVAAGGQCAGDKTLFTAE